MPNFPRFSDKLNLDDLIPSIPTPSGLPKNNRYPIFEKFMREIAPLGNGSGISPESQYAPYTNAPQEPTKPMDVIFNPGISENARALGAAKTIHNVDLSPNAMTSYQGGQLALRDRQLEQAREIESGRQNLALRKISDTEKNTLIREIRENKNLADADKIRLMGDVESGQITQRGQIESGHITERGTQDRQLETQRQTGRESLEALQAKHATELASHQGTIKADNERNAPILPSQERIAKLTRAEEARNSHPEWAKYIKIVPGGGFAITAPGRLLGPSQEVYNAINAFIESTPEQIRTVPTTTSTQPPAITQGRSKWQVQVK